MAAMSVVLAGIGGWGWVFVDALLDQAEARGCRFAGAVDPQPDGCRRLNELRERRIPIFASLEEFYAKHSADLAVISTPPHLHVEHTCTALRNGSHVLCEKPVACSPAGAARIASERDRSGRRVAIGYQWSFSRAVQRLKRDVAAGRLGAPTRFRTLVQWPRGQNYYRRNRWAGRITDDAGRPVLDSPLNNACAHFVHNALYVIGDAPDACAVPKFVKAELYRANLIENYDTAVLRCFDGSGFPEMLFVVSHATARERKPLIEYEFERATVRYDQQDGARLVARFKNGATENYGDPDEGGFASKLWDTVEAIRGGGAFPCGVEAAGAHAACISTAQNCVDTISPFPPDRMTDATEAQWGRVIAVRGLEGELERCYRDAKLPHELGLAWARPGRNVEVVAAQRAAQCDAIPVGIDERRDRAPAAAVKVTLSTLPPRSRVGEPRVHE